MTRRSIAIIALVGCLFASAASAGRRALVFVDQPPPGTAGQLLGSGIMVVRDADVYLLAVADQAGLDHLERIGLPYEILDESVEGKSYYVVSPTRPRRARLALIEGRVLRRMGPSAVVEMSPRSAERLPGSGYDIARVFLRPIRPAQHRESLVPHRVSAQADTSIQAMVDQVSAASIDGYVQRLEDFVTRWAIHDSCQAAADWIKAEFESFGIDSVYFQPFNASFKDNVVAVKRGKTYPDQYVIIGGHYDSVSNNAYIAPGADDNASGVACVLECARIMSAYEYDRTIVFIAFGAEEQGLLGSRHYADHAAANGDDIAAMINADMIGYLAPGDDIDLDIVDNASSTWLSAHAMTIAATYVPGFDVVEGDIPYGAGSDHVPFWDNGYDAISLFEDTDDWSPYMHTTDDTVGLSYNCPPLAANSTKVALALVADLAEPEPVDKDDRVPAAVVLEQNVPNPFNPSTKIRFLVESPGRVASLVVYDVAGREVVRLVENEVVEGTRTVLWNGRDRHGESVASGVYFYRLTSGQTTLTRKMVRLR